MWSILKLCSIVATVFISRAEARIADPVNHPKFVTPYKPPNLAIGKYESGNPVQIYEIAVRESIQHLGLYNDDGTPFTGGTRMFTYCDTLRNPEQGATCSFPGPLFDVDNGRPIRVRWMNQLPERHLFADALNASRVDHECGLNSRGCVPETRIVTHLHGGHSLMQYDGHPNAWHAPFAYLRKRNAKTSQLVDSVNPNPDPESGSDAQMIHGPGYITHEYLYSNHEPAPSTLWYHDHTMGITRLNVGAGMIGMYLVRSNYEIFDLGLPIQRTSKWNKAGGKEFILQLQDKLIDLETGQLMVDAVPTGEFMTVNGVLWPYAKVRPASHRLRIVNSGDFRFYNLSFTRDDPTGQGNDVQIKFRIIGSDGSLLPSARTVHWVTLGPGERVDALLDLSEFAGFNITMRNTFNNGLFPIGPEVRHNDPSNLLMRFVVETTGRVPPLRLPRNLFPAPDFTDECTYGPSKSPYGPQSTVLGGPSKTEDLEADQLAVGSSDGSNVPYSPRFSYSIDNYRELYAFNPFGAPGVINMWVPNYEGGAYHPGLHVEDSPTEIVVAGQVEEWAVFSTSALAHQLHIHQVQFRVVGRRPYVANSFVPGQAVNFTGPLEAPMPHETGWKDATLMLPNTVLFIHIRFQLPGIYMYHCHMGSHEDHDLMRPIHIVPSDYFIKEWRSCSEDRSPLKKSYSTFYRIDPGHYRRDPKAPSDETCSNNPQEYGTTIPDHESWSLDKNPDHLG